MADLPFNPDDYPKWLRDAIEAEGLPVEGLRFIPLVPPSGEQVQRALQRAEKAGVYDPETKTFEWERPTS